VAEKRANEADAFLMKLAQAKVGAQRRSLREHLFQQALKAADRLVKPNSQKRNDARAARESPLPSAEVPRVEVRFCKP
jgi:hypothetical protein